MFEEIGKLIDKKEAPGNLERAIEMLEKLKGEHRANDVVRGKLAHAHFYRGYLAPEGSRERESVREYPTDLRESRTLLRLSDLVRVARLHEETPSRSRIAVRGG